MKLCIFCGTFNPIHNAHLKMAQYAIDNYRFDKVLFIPAFNPPHKDIALSEHRFKMVELAIKNNSAFEISDIEYKRKGKSYTYLTVLELYKVYNIEGKITFIIGKDAYENFNSWYQADKLKELINFIIFEREDKDISSSKVRTAIRKNLPVSDMIPKVVEDYINKNGLYKY